VFEVYFEEELIVGERLQFDVENSSQKLYFKAVFLRLNVSLDIALR